MKIIYCTDIHDAVKELRLLLRATKADLYLLSGDILYKAFYDEDKIYQFVCLQEEFNTLAKLRGERMYPFDLAQDILRFPEKYNSEELLLKAAEYRLLFTKASKTMKEKYEVIEELIVSNSHAPCLMLPGNYDIDLRYTALERRDLHRKTAFIEGLKFAGYGGAPIATSGIPEKLSVVFHETRQSGRLYSEPENFFAETEPDVLVIHNPAYGFFDHVPGRGHVGSIGIRNYLDEHSPLMVFSGHVHEDYGIAVHNGVIFLNTSNFGGVDSKVGPMPGGAFAEIYIEERTVRKVVLNRLDGDKVHSLLEATYDGVSLQGKLLPAADRCGHLNLSRFIRDSSGVPVN